MESVDVKVFNAKVFVQLFIIISASLIILFVAYMKQNIKMSKSPIKSPLLDLHLCLFSRFVFFPELIF